MSPSAELATSHRCTVTYAVPIRSKSGRLVDTLEVTEDIEYEDGHDEDAYRGVLVVDYHGAVLRVPFEFPIASIIGMDAARATVDCRLVLQPAKTIEIERDNKGAMIARHYRA